MEQKKILKYHGKSMLQKSINTLIGIVEGITIDRRINATEVRFLQLWLDEHRELADRHPFNELMPVVSAAIADGVLTGEERDDIVWLCRRLVAPEYFDEATAVMQTLHAVLGGIAADGVITVAELSGLREWLSKYELLAGCWPYDEASALVTSVLRDGKIDEAEHKQLMDLFTEFTAILDNRSITSPVMNSERGLVGVCAVCPEVVITGKVYCFTGASTRMTRADLALVVQKHGGTFIDTMRKTVDYLVIGADGNPTWSYACYGRKVEQAVQLRRQGQRLIILHEHDFHDAVADL